MKTLSVTTLALAFATGAMAQEPREPSPTETRRDEVKRPDRDKSLIKKTEETPVEIAPEASSGAEGEAHFKVQPALDAPTTPASDHADPGEGYREPVGRGYFQFGLGYTHSQWSEFNPALEDGSYDIRFGVFRQWGSFDGGLVFNMLTAAEGDEGNAENLYAGTFGAEGLYRLGTGRFQGLGGLGFHIGSYRAWSLASETTTTITYTKHSARFLVGVNPQLGVRFEVSSFFSVDLVAQYLAFFDQPNSRIGGWSSMINLNFGGARHRRHH